MLLANELLNFDMQHPGDADATVEVPADVWARWVQLATDEVIPEAIEQAFACMYEPPCGPPVDDGRPGENHPLY